MALLETRFNSEILDLSLGMNIILPDHPEAWQEPPAVLYLLHGLSNDHTAWCRRSSIERYARDYNLAIIMPDAYKSFYCDMAHGSDYWTFCSEELPSLIQRWFNLTHHPEKTFVAGLSMGGYGALKLALDCPGKYAAAASLSGCLDLASHIDDDFREARMRSFEAAFGSLQSIKGSKNDLLTRLDQIKEIPETEFYVGVGTGDYLYQDSVTFRDKATETGLYLTYKEAPGEHNWAFWDTHIQHVLEWLPIEKLADPT